MTYYDTVIRDTPVGLWMLDGDYVDATGRGATGSNSGGFVRGPALVNGASQSFRSNPSINSISVPFLMGKNEHTGQPYSLECWYYSTGFNQKILAHGGTLNVGGISLAPTTGAITFTIMLSTGNVSVSWKPPFAAKHHVVGVYTGTSIELYVDGERRAKHEFTETELAATIQMGEESNSLTHNTGVNLQAIATYNYALPFQVVRKHWEDGNKVVGSEIASKLFGGQEIDFSLRSANLLGQKLWNSENWQMGLSTATVGEFISSGVDDAGAYLDSYWIDTFELTGSETIDGVQLEWEGQGTYTVEASVDGVIWQTVLNGKRVPQITEGFLTANRVLQIRVRFTAGSYGEVKYMNATGFRDRTVLGPALIPVTRPADSLIYPDREMNLFDERTCVEITGTLTIGPNTEVGALPIKSFGIWYYLPTGGNFTNLTMPLSIFYENGVPITAVQRADQWTHLIYTHPTGTSGAINITGTKLKIAHISMWTDELTAAQVTTVYKSFVGVPTVKSTSVDSMGVLLDLDASIYANDWSIQKAGL